MLRPSRPMIRPFISSLGRWTTVTVCSAVWSAATRCIAVTMISRAFSWASSRARRSIERASLTASCSASSRMASRRTPLASSADMPGDLLEGRDPLLVELGERLALVLEVALAVVDLAALLLEHVRALVELLVAREEAALEVLELARAWRASSSASRCWRSFSSFASRIMSFCWVRASATIRAALSWAALMVWLATTPRTTNPTATPMTAATSAAIKTIGSIFSSSPPDELRAGGVVESVAGDAAPVFAWARERAGHWALPALIRCCGSPGSGLGGPHPVGRHSLLRRW